MDKDSRLYKLALFIDNYGLEFGILLINGLGYTFIGILFELNKCILWDTIHSHTLGWATFFIAIILNIWCGYHLFKKNKNINELISEKNQLGEKVQDLENTIEGLQRNNLEIFNELLAALFYKLGLSGEDRISFYKFQENKFHIVGRYSSNPKLAGKSRNYYNSDEGFIAIAYEKGHFHLNEGIPEFVQGSKHNYYQFIRSKCNIPLDTLKGLKMKSRSFYLYAFKDSKGLVRNSIIVFESEMSGRFNEAEIEEVLLEEKTKFLAFIERIESDLPELETATETGF